MTNSFSLAELSMLLLTANATVKSGACRDASRASVLEAAGIQQPRALAVVYTARARLVSTVHSLRDHFPKVTPRAGALLFTVCCNMCICCTLKLHMRWLHLT